MPLKPSFYTKLCHLSIVLSTLITFCIVLQAFADTTPGFKNFPLGDLLLPDFRKSDVCDVLKDFAEIKGLDCQFDVEVIGRMTLLAAMRVPRETLFFLILDMNHLKTLKQGNTIRIVPVEDEARDFYAWQYRHPVRYGMVFEQNRDRFSCLIMTPDYKNRKPLDSGTYRVVHITGKNNITLFDHGRYYGTVSIRNQEIRRNGIPISASGRTADTGIIGQVMGDLMEINVDSLFWFNPDASFGFVDSLDAPASRRPLDERMSTRIKNIIPMGVNPDFTRSWKLIMHEGIEMDKKTIRDTLAGEDIHKIFQTSAGEYYIATNRGFSLWTGPGKYINYTIYDGLVSNLIYDIAEDENGRIWLAAEGGLMVLEDDRIFNLPCGLDFIQSPVIRFSRPEQADNPDKTGKNLIGQTLADGELIISGDLIRQKRPSPIAWIKEKNASAGLVARSAGHDSNIWKKVLGPGMNALYPHHFTPHETHRPADKTW